MFSGTPKLAQKGPQAKMSTWGSRNRTSGPKFTPGHENQKDARRNSVQNPASRNSNGAMRCKLWPKTILEGTPQNLGICRGQKQGLLKQSKIFLGKAGSSGAKSKDLGQSLKTWGKE